jgi:hypothetical protein
MKTLRIHTLIKGWCDRDEVLLHAAFQILVDFIEGEKPDKIIDWSFDSKHRKAWRQIRMLYRWWKVKRPARIDPLDQKGLKSPPWRFKEVPGSDLLQMVNHDPKKYAAFHRACRKHHQLEAKWLEEDQANLHTLIGIRPFLWT